MNRILFINSCIYLPGEHALKRTFYLFDMMLKNGYSVHFLTSDFNHYEKSKRDVNKFYSEYPQYKDNVSFISMKAYEKNISPNRFLSEWKFENDAVNWLKENGENYDVVYVSLPTLHLAGTIKKYCQSAKIKIVIDVNDLWPEAFRLIFANDFVYGLLTYPIKKLANRGYKSADCIVAVSDEYRKRALSCNRKATVSKTVYLGAMIERFDNGVKQYASGIEKDDGEFWIAYAGTIGTSYDIKTIIDAVTHLNKIGYTNIRFKIFGQGPDEQMLKEHCIKIGSTNIDFMGFLEYEKMAAYLHKSDLMVNCLKRRASQSVINKVSDYFASGHPVINSCASDEMKELIAANEVGLNYEAEQLDAAIEAILYFYNDMTKTERIGKNAREFALKAFDRKKSHEELQDMLLQL